MKTFKRFTALVLALVMAAMLAVSAYAATVVVKYKVYVYTSQLTFKQYDYSSSTTPSTRNLTILADSSLGSGSALYHVKYVDGALAYCIQPGVRSDDSSNYVQGSSGCWYNLPASVQSGIALVLACGYPSAEYGTAYGDSNSSDIIGAEKWAATQAVIWDLICEYRSPYDYRSWGSSPFYNCVDTSRYPTFALWYSEIVDAMQSATDIPSFAATSSRWCDTIELTKDASGNYSASVTDTNDVLSDFNFSSNSGNGITFTQRGNTLTITATAEAAKGLTSEKTYSATGSAYGIDPDEAVLCWYDSTGKYQSLASYTGTGLDPVRAYIKIKTTVVDEKGSLTISKTDADTKQPLAGVTYRLFDSAGNKVADVTTGTDGVAVFSDLPLGSYTYQEISAPEGYVVDSTKYPITITTTTLNITETRTNALAKGSLTINKTDADTGKALAGVTYRLFDSAGNKIADATTGTNGKAVFSNLPLCSYTYQEISAPEGYVVDNTKYPITITTETLHITESRTNAMAKGSLTVRKVDVTGSPLAGAELLLETSTDGQTWTEVGKITTDSTGVAKWENLKIGAQYRVTETKAPAGYTLLTEPLFTGALDSSNRDIHFAGGGEALYVFESPIDLLSYITLHMDDWQTQNYVACCGTAFTPVEQMLRAYPQIQQVYLCLDNDEAGYNASQRMEGYLHAEGISTMRLVPVRKDWNEDLVAQEEST